MALLSEIQKPTSRPPLPKRFKYHVLFSYASEDHPYVKAVEEALPEEVKVFNYEKGEMWGEELAKGIEHRYKNTAPFCVVFISKAYLDSHWTTKELGIVSRVAKGKPGYMLPVVVDGTVVPEIEKIVWLDEKLSEQQVAERIVAKIQEPPPKPWWFYLSMQAKVAIAAVVLALVVFAPTIIDLFRPSRSEVAHVATTDAITATIVNRGPKRATIVGQRLKFGALPIVDTKLRLDPPASATIGPGENKVKLIALTLDPKCIDGHLPNNAEIEPLLDHRRITLEIDIRESDDAPGQWLRQIVKIPAENLKSFVRKLVANNENENSDC